MAVISTIRNWWQAQRCICLFKWKARCSRVATGTARKVMGDVYASARGTTVMRHKTVPARPAALDGDVVVLAKEGSAADGKAQLEAALAVHGAITSVEKDE